MGNKRDSVIWTEAGLNSLEKRNGNCENEDGQNPQPRILALDSTGPALEFAHIMSN